MQCEGYLCLLSEHSFSLSLSSYSKYNVFEQCVSKVVQGQCDSDVIEFAQGLVERYSGELLGTVCTAYRSGQKCKSIDFSSTSGDKNLRSVLTPILQISGALG